MNFKDLLANQAAESNNATTTTNGAKAYKSTLNNHLDLFSSVGSMRNSATADIERRFQRAYSEDKQTAARIMYWARDIRGGAGERKAFNVMMNWLAKNDSVTANQLIQHIPEYGRWEDMVDLVNVPELTTNITNIIRAQLIEDIANMETGKSVSLMAKWLPGVNTGKASSALAKKYFVGKISKNEKTYRQTLSKLRKHIGVVEQQMCANDWTGIEYKKVPSNAMSLYSASFGKHDKEGFGSYMEAVKSGETKINASTLFPYDIINKVKQNKEIEVAEAQWKALPNYIKETSSVITVVDVSGSMECAAGKSSSVTCKDVAISLGLYTAERLSGIYKDCMITFSESPVFVNVANINNLRTKYSTINNSQWSMNTNLEKVYKLILDTAVKHKCAQNEIPSTILIVSDMQFDGAVSGRSHIDNMKLKFEQHGYTCPKVVFWNVNDNDNKPATTKDGAIMISGFSPAILTNALNAEIKSPVELMQLTIDSERYSRIVVD